jgi:hypothetical protein
MRSRTKALENDDFGPPMHLTHTGVKVSCRARAVLARLGLHGVGSAIGSLTSHDLIDCRPGVPHPGVRHHLR